MAWFLFEIPDQLRRKAVNSCPICLQILKVSFLPKVINSMLTLNLTARWTCCLRYRLKGCHNLRHLLSKELCFLIRLFLHLLYWCLLCLFHCFILLNPQGFFFLSILSYGLCFLFQTSLLNCLLKPRKIKMPRLSTKTNFHCTQVLVFKSYLGFVFCFICHLRNRSILV